ncbi:Yip1 family protein [Arthrobacter sp. PM3]|uniref:Yip1 family protein n=1 Tax=Arthrobacter sp. PM3 TaxID=2017685 RepID=UPI000E105F6F|nr:Yip1 family protein [Arthrobacter sp. PM3]AXJ08488.1 hypothetical protein CFN17_01725 [Arthrobacter sp. PM3]
MSNPPVQPPTGSEPGGEPAPGDGRNTPQYGQQTPPAYGQQAPQYGQQTPPAYGQQTPPAYGQQAPQYGQQTPPAYGQQTPPAYGQQAPQYGQQTPPAYGQQTPPAYGQQTPPVYGQQAPQYGQYGQQAPQYGQYGQQAPQYGQSPYAQYPSELPQAAGPVPQLVNTSFWLIVAAGAVWVISMLLSLGTLDTPAVRDLFEQQMATSGTQIDFDQLKGFLIGTIVVFAVISAGLYALVAFNVRKGKNWARILGTVFAALSVLNIVPFSLATLAALLGIAAIVLLYLPASAPYFQKRQSFANPYGQPGAPFGK